MHRLKNSGTSINVMNAIPDVSSFPYYTHKRVYMYVKEEEEEKAKKRNSIIK